MRRTLLLCLVSCVALAVGGCACGPCGMAPFAVCDSSGGCGGSCGTTACEPVCETGCSDCGVASCDSCSEPCEPVCDQCAGASCNACCPPVGPLTWFFDVMLQGYCGPSCGEVWWGDWHSAPPDCCDPCDRGGNFTGGGASGCESCGTGPSGHIRPVANATRASSTVASGQVAARPGKHAPRIVSVSDRAVDPNQPGTVPQATLPKRMPAHR